MDSTKTWVGYMNVYTLANAYLWGSGWGTADLIATMDGTNTVTLQPNVNVWNPLDNYWVNTNTVPYTGAKLMEANYYVDAATAYAGQTVTFVGAVLTNNLVAGYSSVAFIKEFGPGYSYVGITTVPLVAGENFSVTRDIGAGNITQYGFLTLGPDSDPALLSTLGKVVIKVNNADPTVTPFASQGLVQGQTATLATTVQGTAPLHYEWAQIVGTTTNIISNGGRFSGANTNTLVISNLAASDTGSYQLTVTNSHGRSQVAGWLIVDPLAQAQTNMLIDSGFEQGYWIYNSTAGWYPYNGAVEASTNDYYYLSITPVEVKDGTNCVQIYSTGPNSYNGVFQDRPALPGQIYTANAWFLTPTDDHIAGSNTCMLEVQFRDAGGVPLAQYRSAFIDQFTPAQTWVNLAPTNLYAGDLTTFLGTASYMVAPSNTVSVRYQLTYHADLTLDQGGSVYADALTLKLRAPVQTASVSGGNVQISFPTLYGPVYNVLYKTSLNDPTWTVLTSVVGDGTTKSVPDAPSNVRRFYTVNTQ
ncbi:MAG: hypothetical protein U1F98_08885 [Verrucomicrobiota bacterium]